MVLGGQAKSCRASSGEAGVEGGKWGCAVGDADDEAMRRPDKIMAVMNLENMVNARGG